MSLSESSSVADCACLLACSEKESGAWLHALPVSSLGNLLLDSHLRISVALRLGVKVCEQHLCRCGAEVAEDGHHGLSCRLSAGRHSRHSELNQDTKRGLVTAGYHAVREPAGLSANCDVRPDGITQVPWSRGRSLIWDVTVTDTCAPSYLGDTSERVGAAAELAEKRKVAKYRSLLERFVFIPLAFETFGVWGEEAKHFVKELGSKLTFQSGEPRSSAFLKQKISLGIQRGNAICVLGTFPFESDLGQIFYLA